MIVLDVIVRLSSADHQRATPGSVILRWLPEGGPQEVARLQKVGLWLKDIVSVVSTDARAKVVGSNQETPVTRVVLARAEVTPEACGIPPAVLVLGSLEDVLASLPSPPPRRFGTSHFVVEAAALPDLARRTKDLAIVAFRWVPQPQAAGHVTLYVDDVWERVAPLDYPGAHFRYFRPRHVPPGARVRVDSDQVPVWIEVIGTVTNKEQS